MAIVGIVAIAALETVGTEMRTAEKARRAVESATLAQTRLDWLDFLNETALRALPDTVKSGKFAEPLHEYSWQTESIPVSTQPGVYAVAVRVLWAKDGVFELKSYVYRSPVITTGTARGGGGRGGSDE